MQKIKIFISSVQKEFHKERATLHEYILSDPLLGRFFEPFIFELFPAADKSPGAVFLNEVEQSHIYLALLGKEYGYEDEEGISPTEREFNQATLKHKTRLIFITDHQTNERNRKEQDFIKKAQKAIVRKRFNNIAELKTGVYAALVKYLIDKEIIRSTPFDATLNKNATLEDIDEEKIRNFVRLAKSKRGFTLPETASIKKILTHLNLLQKNQITNAALLLFGKNPQRFFINSEVRAVSFLGNIVEKPIPSYKVFKGDVFQLVNQAFEFILSKLRKLADGLDGSKVKRTSYICSR